MVTHIVNALMKGDTKQNADVTLLKRTAAIKIRVDLISVTLLRLRARVPQLVSPFTSKYLMISSCLYQNLHYIGNRMYSYKNFAIIRDFKLAIKNFVINVAN